jgi:hypothetical protein
MRPVETTPPHTRSTHPHDGLRAGSEEESPGVVRIPRGWCWWGACSAGGRSPSLWASEHEGGGHHTHMGHVSSHHHWEEEEEEEEGWGSDGPSSQPPLTHTLPPREHVLAPAHHTSSHADPATHTAPRAPTGPPGDHVRGPRCVVDSGHRPPTLAPASPAPMALSRSLSQKLCPERVSRWEHERWRRGARGTRREGSTAPHCAWWRCGVRAPLRPRGSRGTLDCGCWRRVCDRSSPAEDTKPAAEKPAADKG